MFGYADPAIKYLIEQLPNAQECVAYNFRWPRDTPHSVSLASAATFSNDGSTTTTTTTRDTQISRTRAASFANGTSAHHSAPLSTLGASEILIPAVISLRALFNLNLKNKSVR